MTRARLVLLSSAFAACVSHDPQPAPSDVPLGPAIHTPSPPPSNAPVDTSQPPAEFWKQGQAACPEGATFTPSAPPYFQASCTSDGKIDGPIATFDAEGRLLALERYIKGQATGMHTSFFANGQKQLEQAWHDGKQHGPFTRWYADGKKAEEGTHVDGHLEGTVHAWDAQGKPLPDSQLPGGTGRHVEYHPDGKPAQERSFVAGQEQGTRIQWAAGGSKLLEQQIDHGVQHGKFADWDAAGKPLRVGLFVNDKESGAWTFYGRDGAITRVDTYSEGDVIASLTYQDGAPLAQPAADQACSTPEGLSRAYQASAGGPLDDGGDHCVRRAIHFPGVVAIGMFAHDRGCGGAGAIVDCKYAEKIDGSKILARAGWKRANAANRMQIARDYVAELGLVWNMSGEPSEATSEANGDVVVSGTTSITGMRGTSSYSTQFRFTPAGVVTSK